MHGIDALLQRKVKVDAATNKSSVIGLLKIFAQLPTVNGPLR